MPLNYCQFYIAVKKKQKIKKKNMELYNYLQVWKALTAKKIALPGYPGLCITGIL